MTIGFDPQYSLAQVLRPGNGFEALYQGGATNIPLLLQPAGGNVGALDLAAGEEPTFPLAKFTPVPFGSRVILLFPRILSQASQGLGTDVVYRYRVIWRIRNQTNYTQKASRNYHVDALLAPQGLLIPAWQPPAAEDILPVTGASALSVQPRPPGVVFYGGGMALNTALTQYFVPVVLDCLADEMALIMVPTAQAFDAAAIRTWDFATTDASLSYVYGIDAAGVTPRTVPLPGQGVLLFTGKS